MVRRSLLEHARRQWRTTRKLIARHRMIARTDTGAQLLRNVEVRSVRARPSLPNARIATGVAMAEVDWSADVQDTLAPFTRQEFALPTAQMPDAAISSVSLVPEPLDEPMPAVPPPASTPPTAPRVNPLVEMVRRVREQAALEQVVPPSQAIAPLPADALVEAAQQASDQATKLFAAPTQLPSIQTLSTQPTAREASLANETPPASSVRTSGPTPMQRRQPMGRRIVEAPTGNQTSEPTQASQPVTLPTLSNAPVPIPQLREPGVPQQEHVPSSVFEALSSEAVDEQQRAPEMEPVSDSTFLDQDVGAEVADVALSSAPVDETPNRSIGSEERTPHTPDAAPPDWVERLAKAVLPRAQGPTTGISPVQNDAEPSPLASFEGTATPQAEQTLIEPSVVLSELPIAATPRLTSPSFEREPALIQSDAPPVAAQPLRTALPSGPVHMQATPSMVNATLDAATLRAEPASEPTSPAKAPDTDAVRVALAPASSATVVPEPITSSPVATQTGPSRDVVQTQNLTVVPSASPGEAATTAEVSALDAGAAAGLPPEPAVHEVAFLEAAGPPPAPTELPSVPTDRSPQAWATRLAQAATPVDPASELPSENVPLPFAPRTTPFMPTSTPKLPTQLMQQEVQPASTVVDLASEVPLGNVPLPFAPRTTPFMPTSTSELPAQLRQQEAQPASTVAPGAKVTAASAAASAPSVPDRSPEAWAARMAQTMRPLVSEPLLSAPAQPASPSASTAQARGSLPLEARTVRPVEAARITQAGTFVAPVGAPAQQPQSPQASTPRVAPRAPTAPRNVTPSFPSPEDRSPEAWAARLFPTAQPVEQQPAAQASSSNAVSPTPTANQDAPPSTPLPESTRRFLRPLVGIDPDSVRVHTGPLADQVTSSHRADALTTGEDVLLASGNAGDSPKALGLLAHELTHVARGREARFVPPVLAKARPTAVDEETLAQTVEQRVTRAAQARHVRPQGVQPVSTSFDTPRSANEAGSIQEHIDAITPEDEDMGAWGGLPAPWEPLPTWLVAPAAPAEPAPTQTPSSIVVAAPSAPAAFTGTSGTAPGVQLAAINRAEATEATPATPPASQAPPQQAAEPNLDALARQVYSILKQRLASERRRQG